MSDLKEAAGTPAAPRRAPIDATPPSVAASRRATGTDTVCVACNLPQGFILQIYNVEETEAFLPNGRTIKENVCTLNLEHGQYHIRGIVNRSSLAAVGARDVLPDDYRVVRGTTPDSGYALTYDIPRDFWEAWLKQNQSNPLVKNRHIFAASSENRAVGEAKEYKDFKSGFQGLNQSGDYRVPRGGRGIRKFSPNDNRTTAEDGVEE